MPRVTHHASVGVLASGFSLHSCARLQAAHLDQGDFGSIQSFAAAVEAWRGSHPIDVLVNNGAC
jgi:NAD(P)-dependent dehydrogenase (short-subunit alcohol dehydrogenase family)